jgi:hypothetical protein
MLVWGGASGTQRDQLRGDGAAFDPSMGQWRRLAPAPLSPRTAQAMVWTGSVMIVWGGYDRVSPTEFRVTSDGAAYEPATDTWRPLPPGPLAGRAHALAVWSGDRMIVLGGRPAVAADPMPGLGDGAAYDPARGVWQHIDPPPAPAGHGLSWQMTAPSGGDLFAWSTWSATTPTGPGSSTSAGGADLFAFTLSTGHWRQIQLGAGAVEDPAQVIGAGRVLLVRGFPFSCSHCSRPYIALATALYDPGRNSWSPVPPDPLGGNGMLSVWTGAALASFDPSFMSGGPSGSAVPGDASAYDPVGDQWTRLPRAPFGCDTSQAPLWTGTQVLLYCPRGDATHDGLALTVEP